MTKKEELEQFAYDNDIAINNVYFQNENFEGLYIDSNVFINEDINTYKYNIVLAHEMGHRETLKGNALAKTEENALQELRANGWAYKKILPIEKLIRYKLNNVDYEDILEELCITPEDFFKIMEYYKDKYGYDNVKIDDYIVNFYPEFTVKIIY